MNAKHFLELTIANSAAIFILALHSKAFCGQERRSIFVFIVNHTVEAPNVIPPTHNALPPTMLRGDFGWWEGKLAMGMQIIFQSDAVERFAWRRRALNNAKKSSFCGCWTCNATHEEFSREMSAKAFARERRPELSWEPKVSRRATFSRVSAAAEETENFCC